MQDELPIQNHSPLYYLVRPLSTVFLALLAFCFFLLFTEYGAKTAFHIISDLSPYKISTQTFSGSLARGFTATHFKISQEKNTLSIDDLKISWHPLAILERKAHIQNLEAKGVHITDNNLTPLDTNSYPNMDIESFSLPKVQALLDNTIPFEIQVDTLNIRDANITLAEKTYTIQKLSFTKANTHKITDLETFSFFASNFGFINADFRNNIAINWQIKIPNAHFLDNISGNLNSEGSILLPYSAYQKLEGAKIEASLFLSKLTPNKRKLENLSFNIKGDAANHDGTLQVTTDNLMLNTQIHGHFSKNHWAADLTDLKLFDKALPKSKMERVYLPVSTGNITFDFKDNLLHLSSTLELSGNNPITAHLNITPNKPYTVKGNVQGKLKDIQFLAFLFPELDDLKGAAEINVDIQGTLFAPLLTGQATLSKVQFVSRQLGNKGYIESLVLKGEPDGRISILGEGILGTGPFHISGHADIGKSPPSLDIKFSGNNLVVSNTAEFYIRTCPELRLTITDGIPNLSGRIFIPKADIRTPTFEEHIAPSEDVVLISKEKPEIATTTPSNFSDLFHTNITLELGNEIRFVGFDLDTHIAGTLHVTSEPHQSTTAKGKLHLVNGHYKIYGKTLNVNYGQILFSGGPVSNPSLDIRAERKIVNKSTIHPTQKPIIVGINVAGTIKAPIIKTISTPKMSDSDVISYLILDQPQSKVSQSQNQILFQAASQLAGFLGKDYDSNNLDIGKKLKLDELSLLNQPGSNKNKNKPGRSPLEDTVLVLGKQLSKRLYLNYSVGIVDSVSSLSARYQLNKHITVEAAGGTKATSADVLLNFESG
ncbi:MAG TPA: translocation/assembly module TamB domain-containing protein [Gammaproteobacteria bacterium]|nr:translocation/assembly module TamB domain-containing protein [Gammaproteobacteria bacterium]